MKELLSRIAVLSSKSCFELPKQFSDKTLFGKLRERSPSLFSGADMNLKELGVKHRDIQIVLMLQRLQNIKGVTNQIDIGNNLGFSVKTVERRMKKLRELGWIEVVRTGSKTWHYVITDACPFQFCEENELEHLPADEVLSQTSSLCEPSFPVFTSSETPRNGFPVPSNRDSAPSRYICSYDYTSTEQSFSYTYIYNDALIDRTNMYEKEIYMDCTLKTGQVKEMAEIKIIGPEDGSLAALKQKLESGKFYQGKREKKMSKISSRVSDEFNAEEPAYKKKEQHLFKVPKSRKEVVEAKEKSQYNTYDMKFIFVKLWRECNFLSNPTEWTGREHGQVKNLIEEQGAEAVIQYFEYCFKNWSSIAQRHKITSVVPSIPILFGYRRALLPEALNPNLRTSLWGAEYTEDNVPSGSWGF